MASDKEKTSAPASHYVSVPGPDDAEYSATCLGYWAGIMVCGAGVKPGEQCLSCGYLASSRITEQAAGEGATPNVCGECLAVIIKHGGGDTPEFWLDKHNMAHHYCGGAIHEWQPHYPVAQPSASQQENRESGEMKIPLFQRLIFTPPDWCSHCGYKGEYLPENHRCPTCGTCKLVATSPAPESSVSERSAE